MAAFGPDFTPASAAAIRGCIPPLPAQNAKPLYCILRLLWFSGASELGPIFPRIPSDPMTLQPGLIAPPEMIERAQRLIKPLTLPAEFTFAWMGIRFHAVIEDAGDEGALIRLAGDLGPVPYSVEDRERRARWTKLCALEISDNGQFGITPDLRFQFNYQIRLTNPLSPISILGQTTALLAHAKPYLDIAAR